MSIFTKVCPRCAADNAAGIPRCACGYVFDGDVTSDSYAAIEVALQEAELYAEYLKARLQQTRETAQVTAADAARNPEDAGKVRAADAAREDHRITKAEYKVQVDQITTLRGEAESRRQRELAQAQKTAWERARKKAVAHAEQPQPRKPVPEMKPREPAKPGTGNPVRPPAAIQDKLAKQAQQALARAQKHRTPHRVAVAGGHAPPTAKPETPKKQSTPSPQAKTASPDAKPRKASIECPHCTAELPVGTKTCRCGYSFTKNHEAMPGIGLTGEEQARILNLFRHDK